MEPAELPNAGLTVILLHVALLFQSCRHECSRKNTMECVQEQFLEHTVLPIN